MSELVPPPSSPSAPQQLRQEPVGAGLPAQVPRSDGFPPPGPVRGNALAVTGFVLALVGLVLCLVPLVNLAAIGLALAGLVLGILGLLKTRTGAPRRGLAIAGIVVGGVGLVGGASSAVVYAVLSHAATAEWEQAMDDLDRADGSATQDLLAEELSVEFGELEAVVDELGIVSTALPVTLTSTADGTQEYFVTVEAVDEAGDRIVDDLVSTYALAPGQSVTVDAFTYLTTRELEKLDGAEFRVAEVSAY